jgi:hypothetical protein
MTQLKAHVERVVALMADLPEDTRPICLMPTAFIALQKEGDSLQAREALRFAIDHHRLAVPQPGM